MKKTKNEEAKARGGQAACPRLPTAETSRGGSRTTQGFKSQRLRDAPQLIHPWCSPLAPRGYGGEKCWLRRACPCPAEGRMSPEEGVPPGRPLCFTGRSRQKGNNLSGAPAAAGQPAGVPPSHVHPERWRCRERAAK